MKSNEMQALVRPAHSREASLKEKNVKLHDQVKELRHQVSKLKTQVKSLVHRFGALQQEKTDEQKSDAPADINDEGDQDPKCEKKAILRDQ